MTKADIFRAYLELWSHVENGTIDNNFFELRDKSRHISNCFYLEINRSKQDSDWDFENYCESNLVFDNNYQSLMCDLYQRYLRAGIGNLGKGQFIKQLMDSFPHLTKVRDGQRRYIKGVRIK